MKTTSEIGNKRGFTLIEVLLSVSILAIGLTSVLGGYQVILESYKRARLLIEGLSLLEEKMTDREIEIRGGEAAGTRFDGKEGPWIWSTKVTAAEKEGWYEVKGEVRGEGRGGRITLDRYVRR